MTHHNLLLQNVRIIIDKVPGVDFTFSGTKVVKNLPIYVLHTLNAIMKCKLCLRLKF